LHEIADGHHEIGFEEIHVVHGVSENGDSFVGSAGAVAEDGKGEGVLLEGKGEGMALARGVEPRGVLGHRMRVIEMPCVAIVADVVARLGGERITEECHDEGAGKCDAGCHSLSPGRMREEALARPAGFINSGV
jgi:hypothetical protein